MYELTINGEKHRLEMDGDMPVARQVNAPVQVQWTREDDLQHDFYRPMAVHVIEASLDADGYPEAWRHRMSTPGIFRTVEPDTIRSCASTRRR